MTKGNHRAVANSKRGRQLTSGGGIEHKPWSIPKEIRDHNQRIDEARAAKKAAKKANAK